MSIQWNTSAQLKENKVLMHTMTLINPKNHDAKWKRLHAEEHVCFHSFEMFKMQISDYVGLVMGVGTDYKALFGAMRLLELEIDDNCMTL